MPVRVVTDTSAGLPADIVEELGITVVPLAFDTEESTTSGLDALSLTAAYARQLERGGDEGVVALHLGQELSSTYSAAMTAAAVFDDAVEVVDTGSVGMAVGAAAMSAASCALKGKPLYQCRRAAEETLARAATWLYVPKIDSLRRSGRLSAGTAVQAAATLAIKPILTLRRGKFELTGKTRTQTKAFARLAELVAEHTERQPAFVAVQHNGAAEAAVDLRELLSDMLAPGSSFVVEPMAPALAIHTGPGAIGISVVASKDVDNLVDGVN